MINNVVGLAKAAKAFGMPTLLTTVLEARGGYLLKPLQDVFPDQKPIDRTFINAWEDPRVVAWVEKTHIPSDLVVDRGASTVRGACPIIFRAHPLPSYATCQKINSTISVA
jgi:nicotinamidase-related amidase